MASKTTSIKFDDEELEEIRILAKAEDLDVSKYVRKVMREAKGSVKPLPFKLPEIKPESKPVNEVRKMDSIADEVFDRREMMKMVSKIHDKLPQIDQLCKDGECLKNDIAEIKQWRKDNEPDAACPSCKHITLKKGRKQQQFCKDCGDGPFEEEE